MLIETISLCVIYICIPYTMLIILQLPYFACRFLWRRARLMLHFMWCQAIKYVYRIVKFNTNQFIGFTMWIERWCDGMNDDLNILVVDSWCCGVNIWIECFINSNVDIIHLSSWNFSGFCETEWCMRGKYLNVLWEHFHWIRFSFPYLSESRYLNYNIIILRNA